MEKTAASTTITVCGNPDATTVAALVQLAMSAGLGLIVQPPPQTPILRQLPERTGDVVEATRVRRRRRRAVRRRSPKRATRTRRTHVRPAESLLDARARLDSARRSNLPVDRPGGEGRKLPSKAEASDRRWQVLVTLSRAGAAGLSFKLFLDRMSSHLKAAGDRIQQIAALQNTLQVLKGKGYVTRELGQWVLAPDGKTRVEQGRGDEV